jgi:hypothetical protein
MSKNKLKQSIAENGGFKHWFVNVFWYHYKWPVLVVCVVLGIIGFITWDSLRQVRYDTTVVIATDYYVDEDALDALDAVLKPVVGDLDGNGQVNIAYAVLYVNDNTELGRQNQERMYLYATQEDVGLYLMSENISDAYTNPYLEFFTEDVSTYGLEPDPENPVRVDLTASKVLAQCGMEDIYLSIMDYTTVSGTTEAQKSLDTAVAMANALVEAG